MEGNMDPTPFLTMVQSLGPVGILAICVWYMAQVKKADDVNKEKRDAEMGARLDKKDTQLLELANKGVESQTHNAAAVNRLCDTLEKSTTAIIAKIDNVPCVKDEQRDGDKNFGRRG